MRVDAKIIDELILVLKSDLTATNQYSLHYRILDDWSCKDFPKNLAQKALYKAIADGLAVKVSLRRGTPRDGRRGFVIA